MLHLYDRATMTRTLALDLDPALRRLLSDRIFALGEELIDFTEYLVIQPGDDEQAVVQHLGFSPLTEPIDGTRYGDPAFHPHWDYLAKHPGWYEMIVTFGSAFAYVLLIQASEGTLPELIQLCERYVGGEQ